MLDLTLFSSFPPERPGHQKLPIWLALGVKVGVTDDVAGDVIDAGESRATSLLRSPFGESRFGIFLGHVSVRFSGSDAVSDFLQQHNSGDSLPISGRNHACDSIDQD